MIRSFNFLTINNAKALLIVKLLGQNKNIYYEVIYIFMKFQFFIR